MTPDEFKTYVNTYFYNNKNRAITGDIMNNFGHKIPETFAFKSSVLPTYTGTIAQVDLDGNNKIVVTHDLDTDCPDIGMLDENNISIGTEYYQAKSLSLTQTEFTFYDDIPVTGNGYYKYVITKLIQTIPIPEDPEPGDTFDDQFDSWEGSGYGYKPTDWTVTGSEDEDNHLENDGNRLKIVDNGDRSVILKPPFTIIPNENYKITVKIDAGNLLIQSGGNYKSMHIIGINTAYIISESTLFSISRFSSATTIVDYIEIEKV